MLRPSLPAGLVLLQGALAGTLVATISCLRLQNKMRHSMRQSAGACCQGRLTAEGAGSNKSTITHSCTRLLCSSLLNAQGKNQALQDAGAIVPGSFEGLEGAIKGVYKGLVDDGTIVPREEVSAPAMPLDLEAAKKAGKVCSGRSCSDKERRRQPSAL